MPQLQPRTFSRREWIAAAAALLVAARTSSAEAPTSVAVYKDPGCQCCVKWIAHLRAAGFAVTAHDSDDMSTVKDGLGVPSALRSCHTAVLGRFWIEGHVPAPDVLRLLKSRDTRVRGLAVPGMPAGSPGMEGPSSVDFDVIAVNARGAQSVWQRHAAKRVTKG